MINQLSSLKTTEHVCFCFLKLKVNFFWGEKKEGHILIDKALTSCYSLQALIQTPAQVFSQCITACIQSVCVWFLMCTNTMCLNFAHRWFKLDKTQRGEVSLVGVVLSQAALHIIIITNTVMENLFSLKSQKKQTEGRG